MPAFRVELDHGTRTVTAARAVVLGDEVRFQSSIAGEWQAVDASPLAQVRRVQRRFHEADGRVRWADEQAVNEAAAAVRPEVETAAPAPAPGPEPQAAPEPAATAREHTAPAPPPPAVSARDVCCPACGEQEELTGRRQDGDILLTCDRCGYDGPRVAVRRCPTCGGTDVLERPRAVVERARGTQLSVVGWTTAALCRVCDADDVAAAIAHGGAVLPKDLPTVDRRTLDAARGVTSFD